MPNDRFPFLEEWLRREPSHNSIRIWIDDDGNCYLHVCDFNGHIGFSAPTIAQAIDALRESGR